MTSYQAGISLCEKGMIAETRVILRTLLEILFCIGAIANNDGIAEVYLLEDEIHRKKFLNKFKMLSWTNKDGNANPELDDLLSVIKNNIDDKDMVELKIQWFAGKAGLSDYYNSVYSIFSSSVHANVRDLEELAIVDGNGEITEFLFGPDDATRSIPSLLLTAGESLVLILRSINLKFKLGISEKIDEFRTRIGILVMEYRK